MTLAQASAEFRPVAREPEGPWKAWEAASQSFVQNDVLILSTGGQVQVAVASGSQLDSTAVARGVVGLANQRASGTTDAAVEVLSDFGTVYRAPVFHATPASAVTARNQIGASYVLRRDATGGWMVAIDTTTNPVLKVIGIDSTFPLGEQYGVVFFQFLAAVRTHV